MISFAEAQGIIAEGLKSSGLRGRGSVWRAMGVGVQWVIRIDHPPFGNRLGIDLGLDIQSDEQVRRPTDCPILLHWENLPMGSSAELSRALDLNSAMDISTRRRVLHEMAVLLASYVKQRNSIAEIVEAYRLGDLRAAFISKDVREILEGKLACDFTGGDPGQ